uniref:PWWP domain-containing protein n=1 Tax=Anopheles melas TaxID=34690 RepID=A0A182UFA2_9DIPT
MIRLLHGVSTIICAFIYKNSLNELVPIIVALFFSVDNRTVQGSPNRTGRTIGPASAAVGAGGRVGGIGQVRRGLPPVQAVTSKHPERVKLAIVAAPTTTEGSTCRPSDVLAERSYDNAPLSESALATGKRSSSEPDDDNGDEDEGDDGQDDDQEDDDADDADSQPEQPPQPTAGGRTVQRQFRVGDLVWGAVRGFPAWPGKVLPVPATDPDPSAPSSVDPEHVWVRWFGTGRTNAERVEIGTLQSLSEGLEMHHRAQKDARKSRKLNAQLEQAIQQAMQELDHAAQASSGFGRGRASSLGKQQRRRRQQRHQRRQAVAKRHRTVGGHSTTTATSATTTTTITGSNLCNRKSGSVRYLRGNKFKAKS